MLNTVLFPYAISLQSLPPCCRKVLARKVPKASLCHSSLREPQLCYTPYEMPPKVCDPVGVLCSPGSAKACPSGGAFALFTLWPGIFSNRAFVPTGPTGPDGACLRWLEATSYKIKFLIRPQDSSVAATLLKTKHGSSTFCMNQATTYEVAVGKGMLLPGDPDGTRLIPCLSQMTTITYLPIQKSRKVTLSESPSRFRLQRGTWELTNII